MDVHSNEYGVLVVHQGLDPIDIDVIAIHGLDGHRETSWTKGGINWLRDFLPNDLPHARILSYGYDAFTRSSGKLACLSLYRLGQNLAADLAAERDRSAVPKGRPIIFVAHSLGGLVLKEALVDAFLKQNGSDIKAIEHSTSGIVFLGTPHRGSPYATHLQYITNILSLVAFTNDVALKDLEPNAAPSIKALEQYDSVQRHGDYDQVCYYETHATSIVGVANLVLVPEASAIITGATPRASHKDHVELVKFESRTDNAYTALRDDLARMVRDAPRKIKVRSVPNNKIQPAHVCLATETSRTLSLFDIPPYQVPNFVDRPDLMERIEASFGRTSRSPSGSITVTLLGMGGQGKTQLGIEYCQRVRKSGNAKAVFWIDATTRASVIRGMEGIAKRIFPGRTFDQDEDAATVARESLRDLTDPWLLVFDGYDLLKEFSDLHVFFPQSHLGSILITSRHRDTEMLGDVIDVDRMETEEGLRLLLGPKKLSLTVDERSVACQILALLGDLPLAIDQARAYILARRLPLERFLSEYSARKADILKETSHLSVYRRKLSDADKETILSVITTWELSLSQLRSSSVPAESIKDFLTLLGFYHPTNIPEDMFSVPLEEESPVSSFFDGNGWNHLVFESIVTQMQSLSLLQFSHGTSGNVLISLHPLVSGWLKLRICLKTRARYLHLAQSHLEHLLDASSADSMSHVQRLQVLVHLDFLCSPNSKDASEDINESFYFSSGEFYRSCGKLVSAELMYSLALAGCEKKLGPDHTSTLCTVHNLGIVYMDQGRLEEAEEMHKRALAGREKAFGPDHTLTLDSVDNLGLLYRDQGRLDEAEEMHTRVLAGREKVLGPDHASTFNTVDNLGCLYADQGRLQEAEEMHIRALAGREKVLGPDHALILLSVNNLGLLYFDRGRLEEAEEMLKRALAGREKVLGPDHASTFSTVDNLGCLYADQGRLQEAEEMHIRALAGREKVLGPDHTSTLHSVYNLALVYRMQGHLEEAGKMFQRSLEGYLKALGPGHKFTLNAVAYLENLHRDHGLAEEAEDLSDGSREPSQNSGSDSDPDPPSEGYHDCLDGDDCHEMNTKRQ